MNLRLLLIVLLVCTAGFAQKKEKIKGNKFVKVKQHTIETFSSLELAENLEIHLLKGATPQIEIETDENLHEVIKFDVNSGVLNLYTTHNITSKKKLNIRITYTDALDKILASDKAIINSFTDMDVDKLVITAKDAARIYMTIKANDFKIETLKRAKVELNLNAKSVVVEMSESSDMKALINSEELTFDLYQKANAKIEGEIQNLKLRTDNATNFKGNNLTTQNCELIAEGSSDCHIEVKGELDIDASGSSEVYIYNKPTITIKNFADSATIYKK